MALQRSDDSTVYTNDAFETRDANERRPSLIKKEGTSETPDAVEEVDMPPSSFGSLYRSAIVQDAVATLHHSAMPTLPSMRIKWDSVGF